MRKNVLIGALLLVGVMAVSTLAAGDMAPSRRSALINFERHTVIAGVFVIGHVVIVHDDEKMARGEACTTVYHYDAKAVAGEGKSVVAFMCEPKARPVIQKARLTSSRLSPSGPDRLIEYQLAGEIEGHGVPSR